MPSILLIDDDERLLTALKDQLVEVLVDHDVEVKTWIPRDDGVDPKTTFDDIVTPETTLVVTDYDLTSKGRTGFFGASVVDWCQNRAIPVGDFSRGRLSALPREPDLFELRIPTDENAARVVAALYKGFFQIGSAVQRDESLASKRSAAAVLAVILGDPDLENEFALYTARIGAASGALMTRLSLPAEGDEKAGLAEKQRLLGYIVGHLLLNWVLRFPGPILSGNALRAYLASDESNANDIQELLKDARYEGPFAELDQYHWTEAVDRIVQPLIPRDAHAETNGELYRIALEAKLERKLARHACPRCDGQNGGFYCPFTQRTVCVLPECSVSSNAWIPPGARLTRIERDFFEEWSPILGL